MVISAFGGLGWALAAQLLTLLAVKTRTNPESKATKHPVVILFS